MKEYPFAQLDSADLAAVQDLEERLTRKRGAPVILIAYSQEDGRQGSALESMSDVDFSDPTEYGAVVTAQETGYLV